jgi:hypothetical protein
MPAKFIASAFLKMYDDMALRYETRKAFRKNAISEEDAEGTPVLLLQKEGDRQYFFVPGCYDA